MGEPLTAAISMVTSYFQLLLNTDARQSSELTRRFSLRSPMHGADHQRLLGAFIPHWVSLRLRTPTGKEFPSRRK